MATGPHPEDIAASVRRLSLSLERWRALFAHRLGLGPNDSVVLSHLASADGRLLPRDLSRLMNLRTGTLTAILDRLENAGLVRRVPNPGDRRSTFVELTDVGTTALAEPLDLLRERLAERLPRRTQEQFARQLADLTAVLDAIADELDPATNAPRASPARRSSS